MYQGKRILLIEDDEIVQKLIAKLCARHGIQTTVADSQASITRALADASNCDMIFVDLILPEITGWEALELIKNNPGCRGRPVVVLTGAVLSRREKDNILKQAAAIMEKKFFTLKLFDEILHKYLA